MKKNLLILFSIILGINNIYSQTNWELLNPKPTASTGKDIDFVSANVGYIMTTNELLETSNAGINWVKKQNISSGNDMSFYTTTGFIVGNFGYVLKSIDSGATWNEVATGFSGSFNTVNIIDANNIILSTSNSVVKTSDGGISWESLGIPNAVVKKTFFTSSLIGHAVCNGGKILKTIDGGLSWYITQSSNITPSNYFTVYFITPSIGFATREHDYMYKTTDGGETWVKILGTGQAMYDFHFIDENNGFSVGDLGATYKTTDGGATWDQIFFQSAFISGTTMFGVYFQNSNVGYATGQNGRIIKTTNGGVNWVSHSENYNDLNDLKIFDSGTGFARSGNRYYKTIDFGNNWAYLSTANHFEFCNGVYFVNENIGYSIGSGSSSVSGDVFKTIDGGVTWNHLNISVDEGISSVFFIDANIGFISGGYNQRKVLKTINGGVSWTQVSNLKFGQIQFLDNLVGYGNRVGYSTGRMYKTIDGGDTWNINIEVEEEIKAFHFVDENVGYFVGGQGLAYKTINGGTNYEQLQMPYGWYTNVNFYSKNVGYISDEEGKLYKTENGGLQWQYLTQQYAIKDIELVNDKIYTAGTAGKIYRSDVEFETILLQVNPAQNINNSTVTLTGNATSNGQSISNIQFEYSTNYSFTNTISAVPSTVAANGSFSPIVDLTDLQSNTTYYYRLTGIQNSITKSSQILNFKTLPDFTITTNFPNSLSASSAVLSATLISNENDITNVEFQYGVNATVLNNVISGLPIVVSENTTENITANLNNLQAATQYFYRVKALHQGVEIYGETVSFTTYPAFDIEIYSLDINNTNVTFSAFVNAYDQDISNIMFEYGTVNYENNSTTNPAQVNANSSEFVSTIVTDLDTDTNYHYRLKAMHNGQAIYSEERVFNLSGDIIMTNGTIDEIQANTLKLKGLINSNGAFLTNIYFEYGLTSDFGSSVAGTPSFAYGYNTNLITGSINNILPNQTYYYRLVAINEGTTIYSDIFQYTVGTLSSADFELDNGIVIYPNPVVDFVNIASNGFATIDSIELYNTLGQRVYYESGYRMTNLKVDLSKFTKGLYFIKVNLKNTKAISSKLILN